MSVIEVRNNLYAYFYNRTQDDLYVVDGLRLPLRSAFVARKFLHVFAAAGSASQTDAHDEAAGASEPGAEATNAGGAGVSE